MALRISTNTSWIGKEAAPACWVERNESDLAVLGMVKVFTVAVILRGILY